MDGRDIGTVVLPDAEVKFFHDGRALKPAENAATKSSFAAAVR